MQPHLQIKYFLALVLALVYGQIVDYSNISAQTKGDIVQENKSEVDYAFQLLQEVIEADKFLSRLDSLYTIDLPVGIGAKGDKNKEKYAIIISRISLQEGQTFLDAYMAFTIPGTEKRVAFKGVEIPFSFNGGVFDAAKLFLVSDFNIPLSANTELILKGEGKSSVTIDCHGFRQMDITADINFDSSMFVTENADGTINNKALKTSFQTSVTNWNDLLVGISLEPFQLRQLPGVGFKVTNAVLDLSDFRNPNGISFGPRHNSDYFIEGNHDIWQGTFIQDVQVRLPVQFRKKTNVEREADSVSASQDSSNVSTDTTFRRITFYSKNILIDELGFSGTLAATQLMTLKEGDMQGWNYSIENFLLDVQANQLVAGQFNGQILVPEFKINQVFDYNAVFGLNGTYLFTAGITESIPLPILEADLRLAPNSQITVGVNKHSFAPALYLNGEMTIDAQVEKTDSSGPKLKLARIPFEGMLIQTEAPYFSVEQLSFGSDQNYFSGFPVSIYKAGIINESHKIGLELGIALNFTKPKDGGFNGKGDFTIWGEEKNDNWDYGGVEVDKIEVDISKGEEFRLYGQVLFVRGDETFGNGFRGDIGATFGNFNLDATAVFGKIRQNRYWFADALFVKENGIPAGPISLYSLSGGAYYHVSPSYDISADIAQIGLSQSGVVYVPDSTKGIKFQAATDFGLTGKQKTFNGDANFEISFTPAGGLDKVTFDGNAYFMPEEFDISKSKLIERTKIILENTNGAINLPVEEKNTQLYGNIHMEYDYPERSFHSNFDVYANIAGGVIKGVGPENKAGWGIMHFAPDDWYVHLGTPENPNGINVLGLADMTNYFMVGKSIPELPLPPKEVMNSLHTNGDDYPRFSGESNLLDGSGLLLGGNFNFDTGERRKLMFFGRFGCGVGFDLLLKNYPNTVCVNRTGPLGVNGWYAQGQAYAWVAANVGINVDLLFYKGKFSIFDIEAATLMQAKAPNPFWMKGEVAGEYNILNGAIRGYCKFDFEIGEQCQMTTTSPFEGMDIIGDISPADTEEDVSVFTTPQVVFNMPVDEIIEVTDENKAKKYFRIKLEKFEVNTHSGVSIGGQISWNDSKDVAAFKSYEVLPGEEQIRVFAEVSFEERINGVWYNISNTGNTRESRETIFTTGDQPPYIEPNNVLHSYPQPKSYNYYQIEVEKNYIKLDFGQSYLFEPESEWVQKIKLSSESEFQELYVDFDYSSADRKLSFNLPQDLSNNAIYFLDVVNVPTEIASSIDENIEQSTENITLEEGDAQTTVEITTQHAEGERMELQEKSIYRSSFRTSIANTLEAKFDALNKSDGVSWELYPMVHSLTVNIYGERFDNYEVQNLQTGMAISIEPMLDETDWYQDYMLPIIGLSDANLLTINAEPFSLNPLTSYFFQYDGTKRLTEGEIESGQVGRYEVLSGMKYYLAKYVCEYQAYLKGQLANYGGGSTSKIELERLYNSNFIPLKYGIYPVRIIYTLPGDEEPHKSFIYNIEYGD